MMAFTLPVVALFCEHTCEEDFALAANLKLMNIVFRDMDQAFMYSISKNGIQRDMCRWKGITCWKGSVEKIDFTNVDAGNFAISFLPKSLTKLRITGCMQKFSVSARSFPRHTQNINLSANIISGTFDLPELPRSVKRVDLSKNRIVGSVRLIDLPSNMLSILLTDNRIKQKHVLYHKLPETIRRIRISKGNSIGRIEPLFKTDIVDQPIFGDLTA